jgi:hypothetical protein
MEFDAFGTKFGIKILKTENCEFLRFYFETSAWAKGHFTLRLSVKRTRDSSNLIGGERKFVCSAFTVKANG